jgi:ABC-type transporter Mla MlaB component
MTLVDCGLTIHGFHLDDVAVVVLSGEVDSAAAPLLRAAFDTLGPDEHVYVDCAGVGFVDTDGLAALCEVARKNVSAGGPLHVHASTALRHSVELGGVGHLFVLD